LVAITNLDFVAAFFFLLLALSPFGFRLQFLISYWRVFIVCKPLDPSLPAQQ
jgi:hypothetical protein